MFFQNPPETIADKIINTFTDQASDHADKRVFASRNKDLLTSHVCVVFMHACDFQPVPVSCVAADLGMTVHKASEYFKCVVFCLLVSF